MAIKITTAYQNQLESPFDLEKTRAFFSDFERVLFPNFPGLQKFSKLPDESYHWIFEKLHYGGYDLQIEVGTRFEVEDDKILVISVPGISTTSLQGGWRFVPNGNRVQVGIEFNIEGDLSLPFFLKGLVTPLAQKELTKIFDQYVINVEKALKA